MVTGVTAGDAVADDTVVHVVVYVEDVDGVIAPSGVFTVPFLDGPFQPLMVGDPALEYVGLLWEAICRGALNSTMVAADRRMFVLSE
jgi:hypothetical protein